ncbi:MAG: hypothetical protein ACRDMJ_20515, partial [Solirubrobacteraceae bacterium]
HSTTHLVRILDVCREVPVTGSMEERIAQIATRRRGRIARRQLLAAGVGASTITWLTARDRLIRGQG